MKRFIAWFCILLALTPLSAVRAETGFNPNYILSDADVTAASVKDDFVQKFLAAHGSGIASRQFTDLDGSRKSPGAIITYYSRAYGVNPKLILALIQKEQSLVNDPSPSDCQVDWAAGYNRPDGSVCNPNRPYAGFTNQIVGAAGFIRYFYDKDAAGEKRNFGFYPGQPATIDGVTAIPANTATALLYTYNPHLHGNQLLTGIWSSWFTSAYPDGSYLAAADGKTYLIQGGLKRLFANKSALYSRVDPSRVIQVGDDVLAAYEDGASIKFSDYSLLRVPKGTVYLIVGDVKRPILSMRVFRTIGFNPEEIDAVDPQDLQGYADGEPISLKSSYPTGALLQDRKTGGVYYVQDGVKSPILSPEIMKVNYPDRKLSRVSEAVLDGLADGPPVRFHDGELVTSPGSGTTVFVISNGERRPIVSGQDFEQLGYSWSRLIRTSDQALDIHPLGAPLRAAPAASLQLASAE